MLLTATGLISYPEIHISDGRPDLVIPFSNKIIIIEFKFAKNSRAISLQRKKGREQIQKYVSIYEGESTKKIVTAVFIANDDKRQVTL